MNLSTELIGMVAGGLSTAAFLPQAWRIWITKNARDISLLTYCILGLGNIFWIIYGIEKSSISLIFTNSFILITALVIVYMKYFIIKD